MIDRLDAMERRYEELGRLMGEPQVFDDLALLQRYAREHSELQATVTIYWQLKDTNAGIADAESVLNDNPDDEMRDLARETLRELRDRREEQLAALRSALVPKDPNEDKNAIVEIRAAAGGDEAALFARELFRMYALFAEQRGWTVETIDLNETGIGGIKEVIAEVAGAGVYGKLKWESGVHRVQRVPATESQGRIHTSTATVIVMPEAEDVDVELRSEDLRIDVYRSSGHGGQGVNTTDSAVRITHLPTGIVVTCQNERSQLKNKASAMSVLRSRLYDLEEQRRAREQGDARRSQVQTGDRSEKIRTYNFPQDRVTDHRIGASVHNLPSIMNGNVGPLIEQLAMRERAEGLESDGAA
ncbi:MAG: peptide chain release factor 1 [Chloroflexota bacterium]|nr:MAG: peptide chain release factor 1 [Chloroflexota bacterium]